MIKKKPEYNFGEKLRIIRERRGFTLNEVAGQINVSASLVSQIERGKISPSLDTLLAITDVLQIDLEYLFKDLKKNKKVSIIKNGEGDKLVLKKVVYNQLSKIKDPVDQFEIEAYQLEIQPGGEKGSLEYGHRGKELGVILSGNGEFIHGNEKYTLQCGDSISFSSDIPHILKNTGHTTLKAIWVISPARRIFSENHE